MYKIAVVCLALVASFAACADENNEIHQRIFNVYLEQAEQGDANAQFIVASFYENGNWVAKDPGQAYSWYEKAAKAGHPLAQRKVEERAETRTVAKAVVKEIMEEKKPDPPPKERPKERPAPKERQAKAVAQPRPREQTPVAQAEKRPSAPLAKAAESAPVKLPEMPVVVAKAAVSEPPPAPSFDIAQTVLGGKWGLNQRAAEILPSALAACLQSNSAEIVCFSQELTGNVNDSGLTYTVKATLSGVNNRDGRFSLRYVYNVIDVDRRPFAQPSGAPDDAGDLAARRGWQEPGFQMDCRIEGERSLSCMRGDRKASHRFTRN